MDFKKGDIVTFRHKERDVKLEIEFSTENYLGGTLLTDYNGKNRFWEKGEHKMFFIRNVKDVKKL